MVHDAAARGFARGAEDYEEGRPSYPAAAVDLLVRELSIGPGTTVVDVGAGTGKFTRLLVPTGATLVGVEPVAEMREVFARVLPEGVEVMDGTAESLPFPDASVDVVAAAQTFHWVDGPAAVAEAWRVLRPGGGLALLWNTRDTSGAAVWPGRIKDLMDRVAGDAPRYGNAAPEGGGGWREALADHGGFGPLSRAEFRHEHPMTPATVRARVSSTSYVSALPEAEREVVLREVDEIVRPLGAAFAEPYLTEVFWCRRD